MANLSTKQFLELLRHSRLLDQKQYGDLIALVKKHAGTNDKRVSPAVLVKLLQDREWITTWHAQKLLSRKYKGFFLGKYKLLNHIGSGGMSHVYLAEHRTTSRRVAIKVLPPAKCDASTLDRFVREARAVAQLNHPNIVRAFDVDNDQGMHFLVMEYIEGLDLHKKIKSDGPLEYERLADYLSQAARGIQYAHEAGLIHRDVKPSNLLLTKDGKVKLLDLGLAMFSDDRSTSGNLTSNAIVLGTADYLSPEQARESHNVDHRADIYSLGCSMYYLLCARPPFPGGSFAQRILKHQMDQPEPIANSRRDCPLELIAICERMMRKAPEERFASAGEIEQSLTRWLDQTSTNVNLVDRSQEKIGKVDVSDAELENAASGESVNKIRVRESVTVVERHLQRSRHRVKAIWGLWVVVGVLACVCLGLLVFVMTRSL